MKKDFSEVKIFVYTMIFEIWNMFQSFVMANDKFFSFFNNMNYNITILKIRFKYIFHGTLLPAQH